MRYKLTFDKAMKTISLSGKGFNIGFTVPDRLESIDCINDYENGWFSVNTNYGEEYLDFIGTLETWGHSGSYISKVERLLIGASKESIEVINK